MSAQVDYILDMLPEYQGEKRLVKRRQDTFDIIREIEKKHRETIPHYNAIAEQHWTGDPAGTARNIYFFLKQNVPYQIEPTRMQTVKTPAAILEERLTFGNDCKHYASYAVGVMQALQRMGYPMKSFYRFASYTAGKRAPGHVFAVCVVNGKEIWIDPVPEIGGFDCRNTLPFSYEDRIPPMSNSKSIGSLYDISGINNDARVNAAAPVHWLDELLPHHRQHAGHIMHRQGRQITHHHSNNIIPLMPPRAMGNMDDMGKAKKHGLHIKAPKIKVKVPHINIQPGKILLKVSLAPARGSFLMLTDINMFNLAVAMWEKAAHDTNSAGWKKLSNAWKKIGGKPAALMTSIKKGVNTHNKLHKHGQVHGIGSMYDMGINIANYNNPYEISSMGTPAVLAAIAAAAPIIDHLEMILKEFGLNPATMNKASADAQDKVAKNHNKKHGDADATDDNGDTTHDDGTKTSASVGDDGTQELHIKDVPGATEADNNTGGHDDNGDYTGEAPAKSDDDSSDDDGSDSSSKKVSKTGAFATMLHEVTSFIEDHKWWFIGGGVAIAAIIILPHLFHHGPKRRR